MFHVRLANISDKQYCPDSTLLEMQASDSPKIKAPDNLNSTANTAGLVKDTNAHPPVNTNSDTKGKTNPCKARYKINELIHINTLLLILVAAAGFAGNMIHIATSFTTFIGAGDFKRRWLLWYIVKPFTASALAVGIYFVFRGGFLNMSDDTTNINLYGVMTISLLSGLFTDRATQKLKEVFEVLFNPKNDRPNQLSQGAPLIKGVQPGELTPGKAAAFVISGENLDKIKLSVSINDTIILNAVITTTNISFTYTLPDSLKDSTECKLQVKDEKGAEIAPATIIKIIKETTAPAVTPEQKPAQKETEKTVENADNKTGSTNNGADEKTDNSEDETDSANPGVKG